MSLRREAALQSLRPLSNRCMLLPALSHRLCRSRQQCPPALLSHGGHGTPCWREADAMSRDRGGSLESGCLGAGHGCWGMSESDSATAGTVTSAPCTSRSTKCTILKVKSGKPLGKPSLEKSSECHVNVDCTSNDVIRRSGSLAPGKEPLQSG